MAYRFFEVSSVLGENPATIGEGFVTLSEGKEGKKNK
jgi:hypothetical protein